MRLFSHGFPPDGVFAYSRHEAAQKALPDLIVQFRATANVKDGYELQQVLIGHVHETAEGMFWMKADNLNDAGQDGWKRQRLSIPYPAH